MAEFRQNVQDKLQSLYEGTWPWQCLFTKQHSGQEGSCVARLLLIRTNSGSFFLPQCHLSLIEMPPKISLTGSLPFNGFSASPPPFSGWGTLWRLCCNPFTRIPFHQLETNKLLDFSSADLGNCSATYFLGRRENTMVVQVSHNHDTLSWYYRCGGEDGDEAI